MGNLTQNIEHLFPSDAAIQFATPCAFFVPIKKAWDLQKNNVTTQAYLK
jgi:hypothetical protein